MIELFRNKCRNLQWETKEGIHTANWFGSITQSSTIHLGAQQYCALKDVVPMLNPNELFVGMYLNHQTILHHSESYHHDDNSAK